MATHKYSSEFCLSMVGGPCFLLQQAQLKKLAASAPFAEYPCHIYMVCRQPRITADPSVFEADEHVLKMRFMVQRQSEVEAHDFTLPHSFGASDLHLECPYPHTVFSVVDEAGNNLFGGKAALVAQQLPEIREKLNLNLEVLYIGKSYGSEGRRKAPERLLGHETLQRIYADVMQLTPDQEVWLLLWHFEQALIQALFPSSADEFTEEEKEHMSKVLTTPITEKQRIGFTEAALIKYFLPEFNDKFKKNFPSRKDGTYTECYDLDLNAVVVELDTSDIKSHLWTSTVDANPFHHAYFPLHSEESRKAIFDL